MNELELRRLFPIFAEETQAGLPVAYLDSAATTQKPSAVLDAMDHYYRTYNANIHRGIYRWSEEATQAYEEAREKIGRLIHAEPEETIFTRNATESINLVAYSWAAHQLKAGDELLTTAMEHHANLVPWQRVCAMTGATLRHVPFSADGTLDLASLETLLNERTRLFAFTAVSNVFGTINPVAELVAKAHAVGALALVDGSQAVPHQPVDVKAWDCDFLVFSGHKMAGPTGIGLLYGKRALLESMPPFLSGGDMIRRVTLESATWNELPQKFEAGTPSIAEAIGLGAAADFLTEIGMETIHAHEQKLTRYAWDRLAEIPGLQPLGPTPDRRGGVIAFTMAGVHPHDIAQLLSDDGVAIRAGHHCAMPIHQILGISSSARASFYLYTHSAEIDRMIDSLHRVRTVFRL